jgi:MSHA biogenesis protein MshM
LVRGDIENYIDFRMRAAGYRGPKVFTPDAIRLIARTSQGLTRRINILADKALLAAFAGGTHAVTATEVKRAVRDSEFYRAGSGAQKIRIGAAALAAGLVLGWATHVLLSVGAASPPQASLAVPPATSARSDSSPAVAPSSPVPTPAPSADPLPTSYSERPAPPTTGSPRPTESGPSTAIPEARAPASAESEPLPAATTDALVGEPLAPAQGDLARERFEVTQEWLRSAPGDRYAIQLATVNVGELRQLEGFLRKAAAAVPVSELFVYSVKIDGQQHYRVAYGSYPSADKALEAIAGLPQLLAAHQPYVRTVERMRSQNRQ